jgi:single-stranded-DNA-specific exonuclease
MKEAVDRLIQSLNKKESVLIVGDYDVDGITSTVMLSRVLTALGNEPAHITPKRKEEGYGLTCAVLERGLQMGDIDLVVALDCGTNSSEEYAFLKSKGIDLLVVDHHQAKADTPDGAILLNPHLHQDEGEPWRNLCTAGLTFKLSHGLIKSLRENDQETARGVNPKDYLALASLGTLADMVPLQGENRILARYGLKHLGHQPGFGLESLISVSGITSSPSLDAEDVTFRIAPRINACGRLNMPEFATELLLSEDPEACKTLASKIDGFNIERREIESELTAEAVAMAEENFSDEPAVVVFGEGDHWNPGVVGIVAGKLASSLQKPCIVLAKDGSEYKGSGRSIPGVDMVNTLSHCKELLTHWGGHPAAVGMNLPQENLVQFQEAFILAVTEITGGNLPEPFLTINATVNPEDLRPELLLEINNLAPFGQENPEPTLALRGVRLSGPPRRVGSGDHFQFSIFNGEESISGIAWQMGDNLPPTSYPLDLALRFRWNHWNGRRLPQMVLRDWRKAEE